MYGCQQNLIKTDKDTKAILEYLCSESVKLSNAGTYYARQLYFKTGKIIGKYDLTKIMKGNIHFQAMTSNSAQQCLISVAESFQSYKGLLKGIKKGTVTQRPKLPGYKKNGLAVVTFSSRHIKLTSEGLRFPLGNLVRTWFGIKYFYLPMPSNLDYNSIKEYRILPRNGCLYIEFIYKVEEEQPELDKTKFLSIDHGMNNWLTCVSNANTSFIIDGKHLKSINQGYNKRVAFLNNGFWSKRLARLSEKRNRQMRDAINKASRLVVNHCLENKIGVVIFGWNVGQKNNINLGKKTNQKFVQIPTGRLKDRIKQLCEQYSIKFVETEESYTSKASFIDGDLLPKYGEKPERWQPSGKRTKRGLYCTKMKWLINADCNGAANIARKVAAIFRLDLSGVSRGVLTAPLKIRLWSIQ